MTNVITIRHFTQHICEVLNNVITKGDEIVITKHGKKVLTLQCYNKNEVKEDNVITKSNIIAELKNKIQDIVQEEPKSEVKEYCLYCKKVLGRKTPAVELCEVIEGNDIKKVWLCTMHRSKVLVAV